MTAAHPLPALRPTSDIAEMHDPKTMQLIWRMTAKDANADEFEVFMKSARSLNLNPLKKQIYCFIYNATDPKKRNMVLVTAISGFRKIADETGCYRPDDQTPVFTLFPWKVERDEAKADIMAQSREIRGIRDRKAFVDREMKDLDELYPADPTNPEGIEKVTTRAFKFAHGEWHLITSEAYWAEYAPIKEEWIEDGTRMKDGKEVPRYKKSGRATLDTSGAWGRQPHGQIEKCCDAKNLRKGWPDRLSNLYEEGEIDKQRFIDMTPVEAIKESQRLDRMEKIGADKPGVLISWHGTATEQLEHVPFGLFMDRAMAFLRDNKDEPSTLIAFRQRNNPELKKFWAHNTGDAKALRDAFDKAVKDATTAANDA